MKPSLVYEPRKDAYQVIKEKSVLAPITHSIVNISSYLPQNNPASRF